MRRNIFLVTVFDFWTDFMFTYRLFALFRQKIGNILDDIQEAKSICIKSNNSESNDTIKQPNTGSFCCSEYTCKSALKQMDRIGR